MPTYIYRCDGCIVRTRGNCEDVEYTHSIHENPEYVCSRCDHPLRRVPQAVGVILKGSGFHSTESRPEETPDEPVL